MSDTSHEPSMEETLASIRQIIASKEEPVEEEVLDLANMELAADAQPAAAAPPVPPILATAPAPPAGLVSANQANEATAAFSALNQKLNEGYQELPVGDGSLTLERLTRELMRPMLREWLDQHLPILVERMVREEIERLVHRAQHRDPWSE
jgi:cell pole-organizing protein PopZ